MPPRNAANDEKLYVGVDPGASGAVAYILGSTAGVYKMPDTEDDLWELFEGLALTARNHAGGFALLEQVGGYVKGAEARTTAGGKVRGAGAGANGSAMFKFGTSYGMCRMALAASGLPREVWHPAKWQKAVGLPAGAGKDGKAELKRRLKQHAQRLFPDVPLTLQTCDALLIAEACRRHRTGTGAQLAGRGTMVL